MKTAQPQEAVALWHPVEHTAHGLGLGLVAVLRPLFVAVLGLLPFVAGTFESGIDGLVTSGRRRRRLLAGALGDRLDQLVTREHAVPRYFQLPRTPVQFGQMFVPQGHLAAC